MKKLISLAVTAFSIAAPATILADTTLYGKAHVSIDWFEIEGTPRQEYKGWTLSKGDVGKGASRGSSLGIRGSENLGGSLKAIYQVEFGIPLANEKDYDIHSGEQSGLEMRDSYVGLKSEVGTFFVGRHDTPLQVSTIPLELFDDTMADNAHTVGFNDIHADNIISYLSPDWGGFQFFGAITPGSASTVDGRKNRNADSLAEAYSLAATYGNGPWYVSAAHEVLANEFGNQAQAYADYKKWRVGLGIQDLNGFYLSAIYENQKSIDFMEKVNGKDNDADVWQGQLGYAFGNTMIKGMYGKRSPDAADETKSWAVGVDHNFSKRTKVYALYTKVDVDREGTNEDDWKGFSLGMMHDF